MTTQATPAAEPTFTTNVWEAGRASPRRVKLTATGGGELLWAEVFTCDGKLLGCGPSLFGVPANMRDDVDSRLAYAPADAPMIWRHA